jgi:hypothetical protein
MRSTKFSDLVLVCEGEEIRVHKVVVCALSPVLERATTNAGFFEVQVNKIEVSNFDLATVKRMVEFMYTGQYSILDETEEAPAVVEILKRDLRLNAIGHYYDIKGLRKLTAKAIQVMFNSMAPFSPAVFVEVVNEAAKMTSDGFLFDILGGVAALHHATLLPDDGFRDLDVVAKDLLWGPLLSALSRAATAAGPEVDRAMQLTSGLLEADYGAFEAFVDKLRKRPSCSNLCLSSGIVVEVAVQYCPGTALRSAPRLLTRCTRCTLVRSHPQYG